MSRDEDPVPDSDGAQHWGVALYNPDNGHIVHIQRVTCLAGAPGLTAEQVVERAHVHARHAGHDLSRLEVVHLASDHDYRVPHLVDTSTGTVVEAPVRRGPAASP